MAGRRAMHAQVGATTRRPDSRVFRVPPDINPGKTGRVATNVQAGHTTLPLEERAAYAEWDATRATTAFRAINAMPDITIRTSAAARASYAELDKKSTATTRHAATVLMATTTPLKAENARSVRQGKR